MSSCVYNGAYTMCVVVAVVVSAKLAAQSWGRVYGWLAVGALVVEGLELLLIGNEVLGVGAQLRVGAVRIGLDLLRIGGVQHDYPAHRLEQALQTLLGHKAPRQSQPAKDAV